jgi:hypothetical protein
MNNIKYVPILKAKEGELQALQLIGSEKDYMMPIIEIPDVPYDYMREKPAKTIKKHVEGFGNKLKMSWNRDGRILLDFPPSMQDETYEQTKDSSCFEVLKDCEECGIACVPVVGMDRSPQYLKVIDSFVQGSIHGICVRLKMEDFDDDELLNKKIENLLVFCKSEVGNVDLLMDFRSCVALPETQLLMIERSALFVIKDIEKFRSITVAASAFPENLSDINSDDIGVLKRKEWGVWLRIVKSMKRDINFGDYAISHPDPFDMDPKFMRMSASIRYTINDDWLIVKGKNVREYGFGQYHQLSKKLIESGNYFGDKFSWGDDYIKKCADENVGTGNAMTWRKVGTNHHLAVVANQVAKMNGSSE